MAKRRAIIARRKNKPVFQDTITSEQFLGLATEKPPISMSPEELAYKKRLQGAILMASQEILREQKDEVLARAINYIKKEEARLKNG